jgi:hypothetical protein
MRRPVLSDELRKIGNRKEIANYLRDITYGFHNRQ